MDTTTDGNQQQADQSQQGNQQAADQSTQQQSATQQTQTTATQQSQVSDEVALLKQQLEEASKFKQQYESLLPEYTRSRQQIAQLVGAAPQQTNDPYAKYVQLAKDRGFEEDSVRTMVQIADAIAADRMQGFQYQNAGNQVPLVIQQAFGQAPQALSDQRVLQAVQKDLMDLAQEGKFELMNPVFASNRAKQHYFDLVVNGQAQQQQTPPPQQNQNISSLWGIPQGFNQPRKEEPKAQTPLQQQVTEELKKAFPGAQIK